MPALHVLNRNEDIPLRGKVTLIGRDPASDVVVGTGQTSWRHALIVHSAAGYVIEDLDSVNGTFVNGRRVTERTLLHPNDRIDVCGLSVVFQGDEPATVPAVDATVRVPMRPEGGMASILSALDVKTGIRAEIKPEAKLRAVLEISKQLSATLDLRDVLPKILESLFAVFPQADRGFILLVDPDTNQLVPRAVHQRRPGESDRPAVSKQIVHQALSTGKALLSADAGSDARFEVSQSIQSFRIRSMMCVPMLGQNHTGLGVIQIETRDRSNAFREEDLDVLVSASTQAARAVELARLYQERRDLEGATQIQKSFLPRARPQVKGLSFFDYYASARSIGGDYYDYIPLPGNRLAVCVGDVAGKGVPAALLMARLSASARFAFASEQDPARALQRLNLALTETYNADRFVTFVAALIDLNSLAMTLLNAGHPPPLRRRKGAVQELASEVVGLPLAVIDRPYEAVTVPLEVGDTVVLYTDGVSEARSPRGELYGAERVQKVLTMGPADVTALGEALLDDVRRFADGRPMSDDLTLVCFARTQ
jgi:serine phosphatase RsbU (regulator of sigma subunit)